MAESRTPNNADTGSAGAKSNGGPSAPSSSQIVLSVKVQAGEDRESWIGYTCNNPQEEPLSKVIHVVRENFSLDDSVELKICTSANSNFLDHDILIETILAELRYGDYLITHVESGTQLTIETQESMGVEPVVKGGPSEKARPFIQQTFKSNKQIQIGESEQHVIVHVKRPVISIEGGYVLIEQQLLNLLKEKVERPLMLESVCLFLGVAFGAIVSILLALQDDKLSDVTRGTFRGALFVAVVASFFLLILGYFVKSERRKVLQPIIDELAASRLHSRAER